MYLFKYLQTFWRMKSRLNLNWPHWAKRWKIFAPNYKNIESKLRKARPNPWTQIKNEDKTLLDFVIIAAQIDTPPVGVEKKYETKSCRRSKMRELQKKELPLLKIIKKEDQTLSPDSGITIKIPPTKLIRIRDRIIRTVDDRLTDD